MNTPNFATIIAWIIAKSPRIIAVVRTACHKSLCVDFIAPLLLRLYLAPVFWMAGTQKFVNFTATAEWFGNADAGLGLPLPYVLVFFVALFETLGAILLFLGLGTRLISLPLMIIMLVAGFTAHLENGWLAIATGNGIFASDRTKAAIEQLEQAKEILQNQTDYSLLTEHGNLVMLNNGIEFAATYFIMLLTLFFIGGGRFVSADYWLARKYFS
jgi:uncharacterized membrane protein YphA (DoxX/SURF4 family)